MINIMSSKLGSMIELPPPCLGDMAYLAQKRMIKKHRQLANWIIQAVGLFMQADKTII